MLDKVENKTTDVKSTTTQGDNKKKPDPVSQSPLKKKDATPNKPPAAQIRRSSVPKGHQNGVVLSPVKTGGKENDGNLDNTGIPITKESSSDTPSPRGDSYLATKNLKLQQEIEELHKQITELKSTNSSLQSQLTDSKRKKENLRVQISALEQADKQQKEKEKETISQLEKKHQQEVEAVKSTFEQKLEEKRKKRQTIKKKLVKKEGMLHESEQKMEELTAELDAVSSKAKSEAQLAALVRDALESKLQALTESKEKESASLLDEILTLKRHYFLSLGLALKLSMSLRGEHSNADLEALFGHVIRDGIPHPEWAKWLAFKMIP